MKMSNSVYDILRKLSLVVPLLGTFYYTLSEIWNLPFGAAVCATCGAIAVLLEGICQVSSKKYWQDEKERKAHFDALDN